LISPLKENRNVIGKWQSVNKKRGPFRYLTDFAVTSAQGGYLICKGIHSLRPPRDREYSGKGQFSRKKPELKVRETKTSLTTHSPAAPAPKQPNSSSNICFVDQGQLNSTQHRTSAHSNSNSNSTRHQGRVNSTPSASEASAPAAPEQINTNAFTASASVPIPAQFER